MIFEDEGIPTLVNKLKSKGWMPNNTVIGFGYFNMRPRHRRFFEPLKQGKGLRTVLRKAGYKVYLVDEYKTSLMCSNCQHTEGRNVKTNLINIHPNTKKSISERQRLARSVQYEIDLILLFSFMLFVAVC